MRIQIRSKDNARPEQTILWEGTLRDVLYTDKTKIHLINTPTFGDIVFMDGSLQSSEYDQELYHRVLVRPMARFVGVADREVLVLGGGEGCTSAEAIRCGAGHVTQIDHDRQAIEWAERFLGKWNNDIYRNTESLNVIIGDAFELLAKTDSKCDEKMSIKAPYIVVDLFDPDTSTLSEYCNLVANLVNNWLVPKGANGAAPCGLVAYFGLWPNVAISEDTIVKTLRSAGLSTSGFKVKGYVHYIPSFCAECLFLIVIPNGDACPQLETGSRWVF